MDDVQIVDVEAALAPTPHRISFVFKRTSTTPQSVCSAYGKVVLEERRNDLINGAQLNLDLQNGMYLLEVTNGTLRMTKRLVVKR